MGRKKGRGFSITSSSQDFLEWYLNALCSLGMKLTTKNIYPNRYKGGWFLRTDVKDNMEVLRDKIFIHPYAGTIRKFERVHQVQLDVSVDRLIQELNLKNEAPLAKWLKENPNWNNAVDEEGLYFIGSVRRDCCSRCVILFNYGAV